MWQWYNFWVKCLANYFYLYLNFGIFSVWWSIESQFWTFNSCFKQWRKTKKSFNFRKSSRKRYFLGHSFAFYSLHYLFCTSCDFWKRDRKFLVFATVSFSGFEWFYGRIFCLYADGYYSSSFDSHQSVCYRRNGKTSSSLYDYSRKPFDLYSTFTLTLLLCPLGRHCFGTWHRVFSGK